MWLYTKQEIFVKHQCPLGNKVKNGLDFDALTFWAIGIIIMFLLISVPSLKSMEL